MSRKITLKDIARRANVSASTVSRALRGDPRVAAQTSERIYAAAKELKYPLREIPASYGNERSTDGRQSARLKHLVLWVQTREVFSFFGDTLMEIVEQGRHKDFEVDIRLLKAGADLRAELVKAQDENADAVAYFTWQRLTTAEGKLLQQAPLPVVLVNRHVEGLTPSVTIDDFAAGLLAARYLVGLGHTRIAYLGGSRQSSSLREREAGFRMGLEEARCYDASLFLERDEGSLIDWVQRSIDRLFAAPNPPTAIWAFNDMAASFALMAVGAKGMRVPDDVSIMGFDYNKQLCSSRITTFDPHFRELGRQTVNLLQAILHDQVGLRTRWCTVPTLVEGVTTGPAPV